jgi:hypothetical protein
MLLKFRFPVLVLTLAALVLPVGAQAQSATIEGLVQDPSGAVIPGASVALTQGAQSKQTTSGGDGRYAFRGLGPGSYAITATAKGFATLNLADVTLAAGQVKQLNLPLTIAVAEQDVTVEGQTQSVSISSDQNAAAIVIKGSNLDALSDDPTELQDELQALAGPAAGPNGGQIYIDGFEGGQIPPKSSILEIRVNQNPFSSEFDRMGYGRVEIITKPGGQKFKGDVNSYGNDTALDTADPFLAGKPPAYLFGIFGDISGPLTKTSTWFLHATNNLTRSQNVVNALNPQNTTQTLSEAFPWTNTYLSIGPRVDFQLGKSHSMTVRDSFYRQTQTGNGAGTLNLPSLATTGASYFNELIVGDTFVVSPKLLSELRFFWDRTRSNTTPDSLAPTVSVQGAFTTGGSGGGTTQNHSDTFVLQDYWTATAGRHGMRFGVRMRAAHDTNLSTAGANGFYYFNNVSAYLAGTPAQYSATVIANPVARVTVVDGSAFIQDDWRITPRVQLGLGLRYEGQNVISDHMDLGPRIALAWSPEKPGKTPPKTVVRAGYGWFYNRFAGPNSFNGGGTVPYVMTTLHDNLINEKSYVVTNPTFYDPNAPEPPSVLMASGSPVPSYHTIDPHFHAALDMQAGIGVDRQLAKRITSNVTYLYTQGVHQYLSNNVTAPTFDTRDYTVTGATPALYNYQYQSGGFYRQSQIIVSASTQLKKLTVSGNYTFSHAMSDTQGVNSFPSVADDPGFDYGRAAFGLTHRVTFLESLTLPHGFVFASLLSAQSGTPYNLTIGEDLTGNNQFNARPAIGTCGAAGVVTTQYGCLDTDPTGKNEEILPFDAGLGPVNAVYHARLSKVFGIGPKIKTAGEGQMFNPGGGGVGGRGIGGGGPALRLDAAAPRRYNLTFVVGANDVFNMVNLGTPNGVLLSPLFNKTQTLAFGPFGTPLPATRSIFLQSTFSF